MHPGLGAFLDAVDQQVLPLGVGEQLRAVQLYLSRAPEAWAPDELGAALSALLSQNEFQYRHITGLYRLHVAGYRPGRAIEAITAVAQPDQPGPGGLQKGRERLPLYLRLAIWVRVLLFSVPLWAFLGAAALFLRPQDLPVARPEAGTETKAPTRMQQYTERVWRFQDFAGPWQKDLLVPLRPPPPRWTDWTRIAGVTFLFMLVGLRLLLLPRTRRRSALKQREDLRRAQLARGLPQRPAYAAPAFALVPAHVAEDTATLLGRLYCEDRGADLDVDRTVRETVRACGRVVPIFAARRAHRPILLLIDEEVGGHPLLQPFWHLAHTWRRLGVGVICLRYGHRPTQNLFAEGGGRPQDFGEVLQQHEGAALVLFSRLRVPYGLHFEDRWLDQLSVFPLRAWLDPDPRTDDERDPDERRAARRALQAGLLRFPFSSAGVTALARYLAADGVGVVLPTWAPLLPLSDPRVGVAVARWAQAAAMVPDASWDQIEEFRRALPDLAQALPDPRYVHRLTEWLQQQAGRAAEGGDILELPVAVQDALIRAGRREAPGLPAAAREGEVRRLLIEQLASNEPQDPLRHWYWRLAVAKHRALLEPERAAEVFAPFAGSPVEEEAQNFLRLELARQGERRVLPLPVQAELAVQCGQGGVPVRSILWGQTRLWRWAVLGAVGTAGTVMLLVLGMGHLPLRRVKGVFPRIVEAKEYQWHKLAITEMRPQMVEIFPGRFIMGSPEKDVGHLDNEREHEVELTRGYYMAATEVSQGQYLKVMGENPSYYRKQKDFLVLPVEQVSWFDAVSYCNRLTEREGGTDCYRISRLGTEDLVVQPLSRCSGYRLPTEAEWEYSARAGEKTIYAGGNDLREVAMYPASYTYRVGQKKPNAWGLYDMTGNVWEWVWDRYGEYPEGGIAKDPQGFDSSRPSRVVRGGSIIHDSQILRVADRDWYSPDWRNRDVGFRVVRSLP